MTLNKSAFFDRVTDMEPLLPRADGALQDKAALVWRGSAELKGILPERTRDAVARIVMSMNGYYSNLIEGHNTRPIEIEAALKKQFHGDNKARERQMLHRAHMEALREAEMGLTPTTNICSKEYLCNLHHSFFKNLPEELLTVTDSKGIHKIVPGELRENEVAVGRHIPPPHDHLKRFLQRFDDTYSTMVADKPASLIAASAAHHRLAWIHPFSDGNGRVTRMFTHLWFIQAGAGGDGLWTLSRGLARNVDRYRELLDSADHKRRHDTDGRGYLSEAALGEFCNFILDCANDQIAFMKEMLNLPLLTKRIRSYCKVKEQSVELPKRSSIILPEIAIKGEIARGEVARMIDASPRTAQTITGELLQRGYLNSDSPKGNLYIGFPSEACAHFFPLLFPTGINDDPLHS
jgi:Fic family protein